MWSVGHSTRSLEEFVAVVRAHGVETIADVRKIARSRRHPQFGAEALREGLAGAGLRYVAMPGLGGLRRGRPDSVNRAWRNESFRAYADYMQTAEFAASLEALLRQAAASPLAVMCAEALWWRCHRSLIADAAVARGVPVLHILTAERAEPHVLRPWARVEDGRVWYPGEEDLFSGTA